MSPESVLSLTVVTRGYELSSRGTLPPSAFLRYLEHIRWSSMTGAEGGGIRRFWTLGVIRAQQLELFCQVGFHEELELTLWISRVGRTSLDMSHDLVETRTGKLVGRSTATIVALDASRRPKQIDPEAREQIVERPVVTMDRPTARVPREAWERPIVIRPSDQDLQQHVNHARYADFVEDSRLLCAQAGGYGEGAWDGPVKRLYLQYDREARVGESLTARTWRIDGTERDLELELSTPKGIALRARMTLE